MSPSTPVRQLSITLNNGVELPALGFGVFQSPPDVTPASVEEALRVGYRMIDAAAAYFNEREVGAAVGAIGVNRSELFLQTKAWVSDYGYDETLHAFDVSTRKLEVDTIDLYMLHQPLPQHFEKTLEATGPSSIFSRRVGYEPSACNFTPAHLDKFLPQVSVIPRSTKSKFTPTTTSRPSVHSTTSAAS